MGGYELSKGRAAGTPGPALRPARVCRRVGKPRRSPRHAGSSHAGHSVAEPSTLGEQLRRDLLKPGHWAAWTGGTPPPTQDKPHGPGTRQGGLPAGPLGGAGRAATGRGRACVDLGSPDSRRGLGSGGHPAADGLDTAEGKGEACETDQPQQLRTAGHRAGGDREPAGEGGP